MSEQNDQILWLGGNATHEWHIQGPDGKTLCGAKTLLPFFTPTLGEYARKCKACVNIFKNKKGG